MLKIGVTGGIGSGKSTVCRILESMGYPVFYSDNVAKQLSDTHAQIKEELIELLGEEVYTEDGLNRPFLASEIFENEELRLKVNNIIHPRVRQSFEAFANQSKTSLVFNEAAILIETGTHKNFDGIILVTAPEDVRINRVMQRDKTSEVEIKKRIQKQWPDDQKRSHADFEIVNDGEKSLLEQVEAAVDYFTSSQGSKSS